MEAHGSIRPPFMMLYIEKLIPLARCWDPDKPRHDLAAPLILECLRPPECSPSPGAIDPWCAITQAGMLIPKAETRPPHPLVYYHGPLTR
jgi:hypothetical protein